MAENRIAVSPGKSFKFQGYFDIRATYKNIMNFIESSLSYDLVHKKQTEVNDGEKKAITHAFEAEKAFSEEFKIVQKIGLKLNGRDEEVEMNDIPSMMTNGVAEISINVYLEPNFGVEKEPSAFKKFYRLTYYKFFGNTNQEKATEMALVDTEKIIQRFKIYTNSTMK